MLAKHNFYLDEKAIIKVAKEPEHEDKDSDKPNIIASKSLDERHVLRVVYRKEDEVIRVITFYPAEKERYY